MISSAPSLAALSPADRAPAGAGDRTTLSAVRLLLFGPGYCGARIAAAVAARGGQVTAVTRDGRDATLALDDSPAVAAALARATHLLSTVPPDAAGDPVLGRHGPAIAAAAAGGCWIGYLSSTGVYGDVGGAWVDEASPTGTGRRSARSTADAAWGALPGARRFRLPGIYGPGRSPLDRLRAGQAVRVDVPGQVFSRIHVDDLVAGVLAALDAPAGIYNLADDLPASQADVIAYAARLLGCVPPPLVPLDRAGLSAAALAFYAENRRVANGRARRLLGWAPLYPDYRAGLRALSATTSPASASTAPPIASPVPR